MAVTRYARRSPFLAPWQELENVSGRVNRLFDVPLRGNGDSRLAWTPAVNDEETSDELRLTAELPGMNIEDVEIEVENNVLTLRGEKQEIKDENDDRRFHLWERRYGSFKRSFTLPRTVKTDEISAQFKDGILNIEMPKAPEAKSRKIAIKSEG